MTGATVSAAASTTLRACLAWCHAERDLTRQASLRAGTSAARAAQLPPDLGAPSRLLNMSKGSGNTIVEPRSPATCVMVWR